jgi:exonuclease SbcD
LEDQVYILNQIFSLAKERSIDAILICGDVYDRSIPSVDAVNVLNDTLNKFSTLGVPIYIVGGNHDSIERLSFGNGMLRHSNVYISSKYNGTLQRETITDEYGELDLYLMPYVTPIEVKAIHNVEVKNLTEAFKVVLDSANVDTSRRCVLMAHQYVVANSDDAKEFETELGGTQNIDYSVFANTFDYTALGHIHKPYWVVKDKVRYCGSPIKYAVRESSNRNSITIVDFKEKGNVTFEIVPLKPLRNLRKIKGTIEEVRRHAIDTDDYVDVTLTDEEHIINAMGKLREVYPHVLRLTYENAQTNGLKLSTGNASASGVEDKTVAELFSDFLKDVYGRDLEDNPNDVQAVAEVITKLDMEEHA